jgi:hypothetical protein
MVQFTHLSDSKAGLSIWDASKQVFERELEVTFVRCMTAFPCLQEHEEEKHA